MLVDVPVYFFPPGFGLSPQELNDESWSPRFLERWRVSMEEGQWDECSQRNRMTTAMEAEMVIVILYVGACLLQRVDAKSGGREASALLLGKCHDLLCGLAHLLGIQKQVMPGQLASGRHKPRPVVAHCPVTPTLKQILNRDFLVKLMMEMSEALAMEESSQVDAMQTIHMCQSFDSDLWDSDSR